MTRANEVIVRRFIEVIIAGGREELLPKLVAQGHVGHLPLGDHDGREGVLIDIAAWRLVVPDLAVGIEEKFAR